jgi:hypothetical protein
MPLLKLTQEEFDALTPELKAKRHHSLTDKQISYMVIGAVEGGSNYWCENFKRLAPRGRRQASRVPLVCR